ncbi:MAG TPA: HEAT repeat domain-containing protein [Spirochaetota bacterium]|nr:HEAT repeat domain-containing protein [Spirochaetota bacterium]HPI90140.1 HEAT repeat domain-containing protein [Spirochaetota bacterium]HPR49144.1 HEAT repeat domain-containing protein [Spirochaetota bacterium]
MGLFTPNIEKLKKKNDIMQLTRCLKHRNAEVRYSAFAALAGIEGLNAELITKLRKMMNDRDPWVQTIAVLKFAENGDTPLSENLMEIFVKGTRNAKIDLLKIIADKGPNNDQAVTMLLLNMLDDKNEIVRNQAIITAGATKNIHLFPYVAKNLHEKHHDLRIQAAKALHEIAGEGSVDALIGLLADKEHTVRTTARSLLETMDHEYARKALHDATFIQLIRGMNDREPVRRKTVQQIGEERIREGLPLLHRACGDPYRGVRLDAVKSIAVFRDPSSIDAVVRLLDDRFRDIRLAAVLTLEQISGDTPPEALRRACDDRDRKVREAAYRVYYRLKAANKKTGPAST